MTSAFTTSASSGKDFESPVKVHFDEAPLVHTFTSPKKCTFGKHSAISINTWLGYNSVRGPITPAYRAEPAIPLSALFVSDVLPLTILDLPREIIIQIANLVPGRSIFRFIRTCKYIHQFGDCLFAAPKPVIFDTCIEFFDHALNGFEPFVPVLFEEPGMGSVVLETYIENEGLSTVTFTIRDNHDPKQTVYCIQGTTDNQHCYSLINGKPHYLQIRPLSPFKRAWSKLPIHITKHIRYESCYAFNKTFPNYLGLSMEDWFEQTNPPNHPTYSLSPQGGSFIPKITQRSVKPASYRRNSAPNQNPSSRLASVSLTPKEKAISRTRARMSKQQKLAPISEYEPQMFEFIALPTLNVSVKSEDVAALLQEGITIQHDIAPEIKAYIEKINSLVGSSVPAITTSHSVSMDPELIKNLALITATLSAGVWHLNAKDSTSLYAFSGCLGVLVLSNIPLIKSYTTDLVSQLAEYVAQFHSMAPQISNELFTQLVTSLSLILSTFISGSSTKKSWMLQVVDLVFSFKKNSDSVESCCKAVLKVIETIINFVRRDILGCESLTLLESGRVEIDDFAARCRKLEDAIHLNKFTYNVENAGIVHNLWQECNRIIAKLPRSDNVGLVSSLNSTLHYLTSVKKTFDAMNLSTQGCRIEPVSVLIRGPPGTGKSTIINPLAYVILDNILTDAKHEEFIKNPQDKIYNCMPENGFFDGYKPEKHDLTTCDDLGQQIGITDPDNEWMKWIRMNSIFEYVLHMAALEEKGNVRFNSKVIIATTNRDTLAPEMLYSAEAVTRRVVLCYDYVPKIQYCKPGTTEMGIWGRRLDKSKLPLGHLGASQIHPDIGEFHEVVLGESCTGNPTGRVLSFTEVATTIINHTKTNAIRHEQYKVMCMDVMKDYRARPSPQGYTDFMAKFVDHEVSDEALKYVMELFQQNPRYDLCIGNLMVYFHVLNGYFTTRELTVKYFMARCGLNFQKYVIHYNLEEIKLFCEGHDYDAPLSDHTYPFGFLKTTRFGMQLSEYLKNTYSIISDILAKSGNFFVSIAPSVLSSVFQMIAVSLTMFATAKFLTYLAKSKKSVSVPKPEPEEYSGKKQNPTKSGTKSRTLTQIRASRPPAQATFTAQAANKYDMTNEAITNKVIRRNMYEIWLPDQDHRIGFGTFVRGTILAMPMHFATKIDMIIQEYPEYAHKLVTFKKALSNITFQVTMTEMLNIVSSTDLECLDCVLIKLPRHITHHADITSYFLTRADAAKLASDVDFRLSFGTPTEMGSWMGIANPIKSELVVGEMQYTLLRGWRYFALTSAGDCGSLMTAVNNFLPGGHRIMGLHSAGDCSTGVGMSSLITQEDILSGLVGTNEIISHFEADVSPQSSAVILDGRFVPLYNHELRSSNSSQSKIMKSPLYGMWGPALTAPARLSPFTNLQGVHVDPRQNAMSKYCTPFVHIDASLFKLIGSAILDHLEHVSSIPVERRVLSFEEAIIGIEDEPDFAGLSRSTSPGFPYSAQRGKKLPGKTEWFGTGETFDLTTPKALALRARVAELESLAQKGIRVEHIFIDCLKDERRSLQKVEDGATRLFSPCPFELLVLLRKYFGSFTLWCQKNRIRNGFSVGVNPYSSEWHTLALELLKFGTSTDRNAGAGDYKVYDGSEKPVIHWAICDLINAWYADGNSRIREVLFMEIVNSKHIMDDLVYEWVSSLSSGVAITTLINNLYNHSAAIYAWYRSNGNCISKIWTFYDHVSYHTFGDDNIFTVKQDSLELFNELVMSKYLTEIGLTYTTETKTAARAEMRSITQIAYLKRAFRYEPFYDRYCAPLELKVILEIPYWTKNCIDSMSIVDDNVNTALRELCLHPQATFDEWSPKIISAYRELKKSPKITSRVGLLSAVDGRDDFY
jgi:hypothetical protein